MRCATGPGYIFEATTPPKAADCVDLAGAAAMAREVDPAADPGLRYIAHGDVEATETVAFERRLDQPRLARLALFIAGML